LELTQLGKEVKLRKGKIRGSYQTEQTCARKEPFR